MQAARMATRLQRELRMLQSDPPPGVCAWPCNDSLSHLEAQIQGPDGTVYAGGLFKLEIHVPDRYPFEPPSVRFRTPIYHPNIDTGGRICLDILNMPPKGAWKPSLNMPTILASIGILLAEPNPDDGLMGDITAEYKHNRRSFDVTAIKWTQQYALQKESVDGGDSPVQHDGVQHKTLITEGVRISAENGTKITNKLGTCSVASTSKLFLGTRLSLERGSKDSGKQSFMNTGDVDIVAVTSKRALACIDNTVATRQVDPQHFQSLKTSIEVSKVKGSGNDVQMTAKISDSSIVAPYADGHQTIGASNLFTEKTVSIGPSSMDLENFKRSPEARNITTLTDSSPTSSKQQTGCPVGNKPSETVASISDATLSVSAAAETESLERRSKYFPSSSCKALKHASGDSAYALLNRQKANYLHPDSVKSRICVAASDARPVRIPLTHKPGYEEVRAHDHAAAISTPALQNGHSDETDRQTSSTSNPSLPIPSKKTVSTAIRDENSENNGGHAQPRKQAALSRHAHHTIIQADFNGRIDRYFTASPVVRSSSSPAVPDANASLERCAADSSSNSLAPQSNDADMVLITGESGPGKPGSITAVDRLDFKKKPPKPAKTWGPTEVIVLDSESDEEPPKGRSRLSLSRRRAKNK